MEEDWMLKPGETFRDFDVAPEMVVVAAGHFSMGKDKLRRDEEFEAVSQQSHRHLLAPLHNPWPRHNVTIPKVLAIGKYSVTFAEWDAAVATGVIRYRPRDEGWGRARRPVINVSWNDAQDYVRWLNTNVNGAPYRLLSEAEWEYACRPIARMFAPPVDYVEWTSDLATVEVGSCPANATGLHDMLGHVQEWCEDLYHQDYEGKPESLNSVGAAWTTSENPRRLDRGTGDVIMHRMTRGGRSRIERTDRYSYEPSCRGSSIGFRVARTFDADRAGA
jgi:formylglycine-generating enzyme required for sulfatase activity